MTVTPATIGVQGLDELLWGFKRLDEELPRRLTAGLRSLAGGVARTAQRIAEEKGLHASGDLIKKITAASRGTTAEVVASAARVSKSYPEGFLYPAVYEYGGAESRANGFGDGFRIRNRSIAGVRLIAQHGLGAGNLGPRAFLEPAAEHDAPAVIAGVQELVAQTLRDAGF